MTELTKMTVFTSHGNEMETQPFFANTVIMPSMNNVASLTHLDVTSRVIMHRLFLGETLARVSARRRRKQRGHKRAVEERNKESCG
jgi:hypothetical protein